MTKTDGADEPTDGHTYIHTYTRRNRLSYIITSTRISRLMEKSVSIEIFIMVMKIF